MYFNTTLSAEFQNSPYNKRQDSYEERVVRGNIYAASGEVLAETHLDEEGNESRSYPYDNLFSHVVGYTSKGKSGLESTENYHLLTSHAGAIEQVQNEMQDQKNIGDNVITTLDLELQQAAYWALGDHDGAVVVMEPDTGKILAMVSKPDFNPNDIDRIWDDLIADESNSNLLNRAIQGLYPPGSTFKIVTSLAYMRSGGNIDEFRFDCQGEVTNGGFTVHCYNNNVHGEEDFETAFAKSCNSAFAQLGVDLDGNVFKQTAEQMLFNKKLPMTLPYNKGSFVMDSSTADALAMQTAIGQGETVTTPFHMALITSAVANGGNLMKPYFVDRIENYNGELVKKYKPEIYSQLMTSEEASVISQMMEGVVLNGTASRLAGQSYTAAGKTGTAEHGDMSGSPHAWFVGFSNVENPELVVSVIVESSGTGSEIAVPVAQQIFDAYYN